MHQHQRLHCPLLTGLQFASFVPSCSSWREFTNPRCGQSGRTRRADVRRARARRNGATPGPSPAPASPPQHQAPSGTRTGVHRSASPPPAHQHSAPTDGAAPVGVPRPRRGSPNRYGWSWETPVVIVAALGKLRPSHSRAPRSHCWSLRSPSCSSASGADAAVAQALRRRDRIAQRPSGALSASLGAGAGVSKALEAMRERDARRFFLKNMRRISRVPNCRNSSAAQSKVMAGASHQSEFCGQG